MLRRLNKVLPDLILAIVLYGVMVWAVGLWLVGDKMMFSAGLLIGVCLAVGMAIHMAVVIEDAVSAGSSQAKVIAMSLLRYAAVVLVFAGMIRFRLGDPIAAFIGVMGLKIAAYVQPFFHKVIVKFQRKEDASEKKQKMQEKNYDTEEVRM